MQPALTTSSEIVLSYNMNTSRVSQDGCLDEHVLDASIYRPRFVRVPRSALPTAASTASATAAPPAKPGTISQRPALAWNNKNIAARAGATAKSPTTAAAAAAVPIPVGSVTWVDRNVPCGTNAGPSNFSAVPGVQTPSPTTQVSWDYKGPTVDTSVSRKRPGEDWSPLPVMLFGASPLPQVPANEGPPISLLSGSPQRVRWTDTPYASSGQTVSYKLCMKPATVFLDETRDCRITSVTLP
jgi:hypothetical protein